jgi:hypothetical protein
MSITLNVVDAVAVAVGREDRGMHAGLRTGRVEVGAARRGRELEGVRRGRLDVVGRARRDAGRQGARRLELDRPVVPQAMRVPRHHAGRRDRHGGGARLVGRRVQAGVARAVLRGAIGPQPAAGRQGEARIRQDGAGRDGSRGGPQERVHVALGDGVPRVGRTCRSASGRRSSCRRQCSRRPRWPAWWRRRGRRAACARPRSDPPRRTCRRPWHRSACWRRPSRAASAVSVASAACFSASSSSIAVLHVGRGEVASRREGDEHRRS